MPIRAWNGSSWIQPQFRDGFSWRRQNDYIPAKPPIYSNVGVWDFSNGTNMGWSAYSAFNDQSEPYSIGTQIRQDQLTGGLFGQVNTTSPSNSVGLPIGTAYRARAAVYIRRRTGTLPTTKKVKISCEDAVLEETQAAGNTGWREYITPVAYTQYAFTSFNVIFQVDSGALDSNSLYTYDMDWCRIEDAAGNVLQYISTPAEPAIEAWPKWWDGTRWRD